MDQQQQQPGSHISDEAAGATDGDSSAVVSPTAIGSRHQGSRPSRSPSSHQLLVGCGSNQFDYGSVLRGTLLSLESELLAAGLQAGSTALVALLVDGTLFLANVGDCRAVVSDDAEARVLTWWVVRVLELNGLVGCKTCCHLRHGWMWNCQLLPACVFDDGLEAETAVGDL
jgi:hypothetical protein